MFADVKSLYSDVAKRDAIGQLAEDYRVSLEKSSTFGVSDSEGTRPMPVHALLLGNMS